ncbi:hypothetical protein L195_g022943 [Trifolium pratense]|uniref:Uncharacterized protein n=1 Tax=Trifolium pratense TaxID=57577 RepID=A0A2K3N9I8_TRIPR|nr:hypothetical protein L195_g022943 [Trifolium pratense]
MTMMLCYLTLNKRLKKRKRSRDWYEGGELLPTQQSRQGNEFGLNLNKGEEDFESQCDDATAYKTKKRASKRVKYNDDVYDSLLTSVNKLCEFYASSVEDMQQLSSCFLHEKRTAERRNRVVSVLQEMEGLSTNDVVRAAILITKDNNLCDCFFTMDTFELRKEFVHFVLSNKGC